MDYSEAIEKIKNLDNGTELVNAVKARIELLIGEKREATNSAITERDRLSSITSTLSQIATVLNIQDQATETIHKSILTKVNNLTTEIINNQKAITNLEALKNTTEAKVAETENLLKNAERNIQITEAAIASSANPNVLKKLLKDSNITLEITQAEDNSKQVLVVDGESKLLLSEYASNKWADFVPSLFPTSAPPPKAPPIVLPTGNPNGKAEQKNPVAAYIASAGFGPKKE